MLLTHDEFIVISFFLRFGAHNAHKVGTITAFAHFLLCRVDRQFANDQRNKLDAKEIGHYGQRRPYSLISLSTLAAMIKWMPRTTIAMTITAQFRMQSTRRLQTRKVIDERLTFISGGSFLNCDSCRSSDGAIECACVRWWS